MTNGTMHAIQIEDYGGPEVFTLVDVPIPQQGEGQVLIRVYAAGSTRQNCLFYIFVGTYRIYIGR